MLAAHAGALTLVEFDADLAAHLQARYLDKQSVTVVDADARGIDPVTLPGVGYGPYRLVSNLPYYAGTPIIRNFLESSHPPEVMVVMVQREVASEMAAVPGKMGMLSVAMQMYADVEKLFDVPPSAFRPPPKVTSTVVKLIPLGGNRLKLDNTDNFFRIVRAGFSNPRKQLHNSLARGLGVEPSWVRPVFEDAGIDSARRPATLSIAEWGTLYHAWRNLEIPEAEAAT